MSFLKIFAPDSQETDEDYVNRLLDDLNNPKKYKEALIDLSPFSRQFRNIIGLKSSSTLVKLLLTSDINDETTSNILKIMNELVRDDSLDSCSNSGYLLDEEENFLQKVFECLVSKVAQIRGLSLGLIKNLLKLQTQKVRSYFAKNGRSQKDFCSLINEKVEIIKTNFLYLLPDLIGDNQDVQQILAFQLMDPLVENINAHQSNEVIPAILALLKGNVKMQKLFVETGHLSKLYRLIENRDENAIDLLILLFQSPDACSFRNLVQESGILNPILKNISNNKNFSRYITLLGYIIKGNAELTSSLSNGIDKLISLVIFSKDQQEQKSGLFFIDCYNLKGAKIVAESLCNNNKLINSILPNYNEMISENYAIYSIAYSCLISDIEYTRNIFYGKSLLNGKYFLTFCLEMISKISDSKSIILQAALKFISTIIWESTTITNYFITTLSSFQRKDQQSSIVFLLSLCIEEGHENNEVKNITSLLLLESLLFKKKEPIFDQLINSIKTRVGITLLITNMDNYVDSLKEQSLWSDFVKDITRVIKKNKDNLLDNQSEIKSDLTLQAQINKLTEENSELVMEKEKLTKENEEYQKNIDSLEQQILDIQTVIPTYEKCLNDQQEALNQSNEEKNILNEKLEKLRSKMLNMNEDNEFEEKYNNLLTQYDETKNSMSLDIEKLKDENQQLKDKLYSSDATNQLQKENEDLRKQIEQNKKHIDELTQVDTELQNSKKEINNLIQEKINLEASLQAQKANENNIDNIIQENENYKSIIAQLESKLSQIKENGEIEKKNPELNNEQQKIIDELNQKIVKIQKDLDEAKRLREYDNENFVNNISEIQKNNKDTETELVSALEENEALKNDIEEKESTIQELRNKIKSINSYQINNETENNILSLNEENQRLNSEIKSLTNDKNLLDTINNLKKENKELNNVIETNNEKITILENQINNMNKENNNIKDEQQKAKIAELTELINNYQNKIQKDKNEKNLLKEKNQKFKELFINLEKKLEKREQELKHNQEINKQLEVQIKKYEKAKIQTQNNNGNYNVKSNLIILEQQFSNDQPPIDISSLKENELIELISTQVTNLISNFTTNEQELKSVKEKYKKNKELKKNLKKSAQTAILNISQLKEQIKQLNSRNEILNQKNNELKQEINVVTQNNKNIQEKHQSALRLIGELWTRNQSLLQQQQQ